MVQKYRKSLILLYFRYLQHRMNAPFSASQSREFQLEQSLRKIPWLIPFVTLFTAALLYWAQGYFLQWFEAGHYWVVLFSGMMAHGFFILLVHDGAHKSITRTAADRYIMNLGAGLMLMPFYAEPFRRYHLIHHANTNTDVDPLWPESKKALYHNHRWLYVLCSLLPLLFTLYSIVTQQKRVKKMNKKVMSPKINGFHIAWASVVTLVVVINVKPSLAYVLSTLLVLNAFSVLRHWCEHVGYNNEHESNTFWFPFGMGVGNHDVHHHVPHLSWFTLLLGLFSRPKTTSVPKAIYGVLFDPQFEHYEAK
ncbi:MAG: hypothetical protein EBT60_05460 [Bacteroidetes bacterium]|jgi:fatty acid desaturase|nr:hypothetical protein [Bacteroidota bacterium]